MRNPVMPSPTRSRNPLFRAHFWVMLWLVSLCVFSAARLAWPATTPPAPSQLPPTFVGNGDEGTDLENLAPIQTGPILDARAAALAQARKLGVGGIRGLGTLEAELEKSELFLAKEDVPAHLAEDQGSYHSGFKGQVYARTFPRAHAATRFFPAALALTGPQLVALHLHEALHRALPPAVQTDESVVSRLTLALSTPDATRDQVETLAAHLIPASALPADTLVVAAASAETPAQTSAAAVEVADDRRIESPSSLTYAVRLYREDPDAPGVYPVKRMMILSGFFYPFGKVDALGFGVEAGLVESGRESQTKTLMGPLGLTMRYRAFTVRDYDFGTFAGAYLNTLSSDEWKNSGIGRDVGVVGINAIKARGFIYGGVDLKYQFAGSAQQKVGNVTYKHEYGGVFSTRLAGGVRIGPVRAGGFGSMYLGDGYRVSGGSFTFGNNGSGAMQRYRLVSYGPEVNLELGSFRAGVQASMLASSTSDANFDFLGNLMPEGVALGSVQASVGVVF